MTARDAVRRLRVPVVLERLSREIFAVKRDDRAFTAVGVRYFLNVELKVDRADDSVAKLFMDQGLERRAVDLHHLVEAIDCRIGRHTARDAPADRNSLEQASCVFPQLQLVGDNCCPCSGNGCWPSRAAVTNARPRPVPSLIVSNVRFLRILASMMTSVSASRAVWLCCDWFMMVPSRW